MLPPSIPVTPADLQPTPKVKHANASDKGQDFAAVLESVSHRDEAHEKVAERRDEHTNTKQERSDSKAEAKAERREDKADCTDTPANTDEAAPATDAASAEGNANTEPTTPTVVATNPATTPAAIDITITNTGAAELPVTPTQNTTPGINTSAIVEPITAAPIATPVDPAAVIDPTAEAPTELAAAKTPGPATFVNNVPDSVGKPEFAQQSVVKPQVDSPEVAIATPATGEVTVSTPTETPEVLPNATPAIDNTAKPATPNTLQTPQQPVTQTQNQTTPVTDTKGPVVSAPPHTHGSAPFRQLVEVVAPLRHRRDGDYSMTLQLHPQDLGRVEVAITLQAGQISMQLNADNPAARQMLRDQLNDLRQSLESGGLQTGSLDVETGDNHQAQNNATPSGGNRDQSADYVMDDDSFFTRLNTVAPPSLTADGAVDVRI